MKIHLCLLMFLQLHQHQCFLDGSFQHVKQLVIFLAILEINFKHVLSFSEPLLFWLKFLRIMIQKLLQKLQDAAMDEEYCSLMANDTWDLAPLLKQRKLVRCKWVYRIKYASDESVERLKARLVSNIFFPSLRNWLQWILFPCSKNELHPPCSFPCSLT